MLRMSPGGPPAPRAVSGRRMPTAPTAVAMPKRRQARDPVYTIPFEVTLGTAEITNPTATGTKVFDVPLDRLAFPASSSIRRLMAAFERYSLSNVRLTAVATAPSSVGGSLIVAALEDPTTELAAEGAELVDQLSASPHGFELRLWNSNSVRMPSTDWLYTAGGLSAAENEELITTAARIVAAASTTISGATYASVLFRLSGSMSFADPINRAASQDSQVHLLEFGQQNQLAEYYFAANEGSSYLWSDDVAAQDELKALWHKLKPYSQEIYIFEGNSTLVGGATSYGQLPPTAQTNGFPGLRYVWINANENQIYFSNSILDAQQNNATPHGAGVAVSFTLDSPALFAISQVRGN